MGEILIYELENFFFNTGLFAIDQTLSIVFSIFYYLFSFFVVKIMHYVTTEFCFILITKQF